MIDAIVLKNLTKRYGDKCAVNNLNMTVHKGELFSLLGVNGAGKTTTIKMMSCLTKPTGGNAELMGYSIMSDNMEIKKIIGVSPQETAVAPNLTLTENLELIGRLHGYSRKTARDKAEELVRRFSMSEYRNKKAKTLSGGWQRRLSIAMAIITEPQILFLDEPTLGLDVLARHELWDIIKELRGSTTIILTTHYLEEAEKLSDRIAVMRNGALEALGTADELIAAAGTENFEDAFVKLAAGGESI